MTLAWKFTPRLLKLGPLLRSRRAWIGIDIGSAATKLVQLERVEGEVRFAARWLVDEYPDGMLTRGFFEQASGLPFQAQLKNARAAFRGRRSAATLPTTVTDLRSLELPAGTDNELRSMIQEELQAESPDNNRELCFDYVPTPSPDSSEGNLNSFGVFAVAKDVALRTANALAAAGLDCEVLDSHACAVARAVELCEPVESKSPIAALDFGESSAVFVLTREGKPLFTRQLRGWGLHALLTPLQEGLRLSASEAKHLLTRNQQCPESSSLASLAHTAQNMIVEPLSQFTAEVKRTLDFIDLRFRSIIPKQLILFGCGALVSHLPDTIARNTGLPVRPWSLPSVGQQPPRPDDALFGVAAALSSLAWETRGCM